MLMERKRNILFNQVIKSPYFVLILKPLLKKESRESLRILEETMDMEGGEEGGD
jgi:hypothetical protein